jgi:hypothetical protein
MHYNHESAHGSAVATNLLDQVLELMPTWSQSNPPAPADVCNAVPSRPATS